ncbi:phospholipid-transporting ATPase 2 isoform X1, partial [Tanacetum coccineum]
LVELLKSCDCRTLAIGEGGNDVRMIQQADIGVGISGRKGLQAARAADYSIGKFRYCVSGTSLFNSVSLMAYNVFYTSVPVLVSVLDKDLSEKTVMQHPHILFYCQAGRLLNPTTFAGWFGRALFHAIVVFAINMHSYAFEKSEMEEVSMVALSGCVWLQAFVVTLETNSFTILQHLAIWGNLVVFYIINWIVSALPRSGMYTIMYRLCRQPAYWNTMFLIVAAGMGPMLALKTGTGKISACGGNGFGGGGGGRIATDVFSRHEDLKIYVHDYGLGFNKIPLYCDNKSAIALCCNNVQHSRFMSSITAQQAKLDLELVPKEKRFVIGNCNGRLNLGKTKKEATFQVVLDALALTPCYQAFLITADICPKLPRQDFDELPSKEDIVSSQNLAILEKSRNSWIFLWIKCINLGELLLLLSTNVLVLTSFVSLELKFSGLCTIRRMWIMLNYYGKDFIYQIDNKDHKKQEKMYYPRFTKVIIHHFLTKDKTLSWRNKINMHTSRDDYLLNNLRFVSSKQQSQIYEAKLPEVMTNQKMRDTDAYKTYLGFATGVTPPKIARKFKKASPSKRDITLNLVPVNEEPKTVKKKVTSKKTTTKRSTGVVIRDTPTVSVSKKKEKVSVDKGKGIELLSNVALIEIVMLSQNPILSQINLIKTPFGYF